MLKIRKKNPTVVETACKNVLGFELLQSTMKRKMTISGRSESTFTNYIRCLAHMSNHFNHVPHELETDQVEEYLYFLKKEHNTPSESFFKHTVYGLRNVYKMYGMKNKHISLPSIERSKKLPVVMNDVEVKLMLRTPKLLKHRVILSVLYDCGVRCFELRNIKLSDLDFRRKQLHVKQGKGRKDRYIPLTDILIRGIKKYIRTDRPEIWLFNGQPDKEGNPTSYSQNGIQWIVRQTRKELGLSKPITTHTFRHTYATHLVEFGMDLPTLRTLLGHSLIETTMIYVHLAQSVRNKPFGPFDKIYN